MTPSEQSIITRTEYHASLSELVRETERYASLARRVAEAARAHDPDGTAAESDEERAAFGAVAAHLRAACEAAPGLADVFALAAGKFPVPVPGR